MADEDLNLYDEIEIEDCFYDETLQIYHHPCPCGDRFEISIADMRDGEDIARCPSCSLMIRIIFDAVWTFTDYGRYKSLMSSSPIFHLNRKTVPHKLLPSPLECAAPSRLTAHFASRMMTRWHMHEVHACRHTAHLVW